MSFPSGEHADVIASNGVVGIGSAQGNRVVLPGARPTHARIVLDSRGMVLEVLDAQARTHVNARPVLEKAILRLGDTVSIDAVAMVLKPDSDDVIDNAPPTSDLASSGRSGVASVVLRGVSGAHFGKTIAVGDRLVIGQGRRGLELDEPGMGESHAAIDVGGDMIRLRDLGSTTGTAVNGVVVRDAVLHPGDQIAFGRNRFVLEAPGYAARGQRRETPPAFAPAITQTMPAIQIPDPPAEAEPRSSSVWWLILAAALIGICIAGVIWVGGR
ncbi:MAG: FHA domain-containing protein [Xanthomonadales bacterium]|nr:FHA domain-containing protein [Xanthomonadales bacterium]